MHNEIAESSRRLDFEPKAEASSACHRADFCVLQAGHDGLCSPTFRTAEIYAQERVMLRITWHDRRASNDDCVISLAEFLTVNDEEEWPQVVGLKVGGSVELDWTTVTRVADGSPRVGAKP